jgi:hypothetical protein
VTGGLSSIFRHPFVDRDVGFFHAVVRTAVNSDGRFAGRRFRRKDLAGSFKGARHLDAKVALQRRARPQRVVIQKDVVAVGWSLDFRLAPTTRHAEGDGGRAKLGSSN